MRTGWRLANARGMHLIEIVFVTAISTIVVAVIFVLSSTGRNVYFTAEAKMTTGEESRKAFDTLQQDLQDAKVLSYCADDGGNNCPTASGGFAAMLTFQKPGLASPGDPTSFYNPSGAGTMTWDTAHEVVYQWTRNDTDPQPLYRCSPGADCRAIALRVRELALVPLNASGANSFTPSSPTFAFYNADGTAKSTMPAMIQMAITVDSASTPIARQVPSMVSTCHLLLNPQQ